MTAPNSTDDIDTIKLAVSQTMLHTSGVIKRWNNPSIHPKELNAELDAIFHEQVAAIQAEVQRQVVAELDNVLYWAKQDRTEQYIQQRIAALQQGDNGSTTLKGNTEYWSKETDD